jgi:hypothetical protein
MLRKSLRQFDPYQMAKLDTAMWQAYYGHKFFRLSWLLVWLMRIQFGLGWLQAGLAAYYCGRAAASFKKGAAHKNYAGSLHFLRRLFVLVNRHSSETFDPGRIASLELAWWLVHRYPTKHRQTLEVALADAMAAIYNVDAMLLLPYARDRAAAMHIRDTARWQQHTEPDWEEIERLLERSYIGLRDALR